ncbi:MAG: sulfotransferase family protein [Okeania sp. SIO2C9]|uniref:sulfotransferase family 2 domain-containing protein n=1 Tax=Okeania sp. SIO2C9 TaxID=2607791 RepID=UPI0013C038A6|nr:sulfotransferase family 2 domain-containing protein [Okeania sp. SIO2C9]NEQ78518.1 sulfotransferase family protein [Okeania sp. SIO2C9]
MIVSIHIPKTAGTSLRCALSKEFGQQLLLDYGRNNPDSTLELKFRKFLIQHPNLSFNKSIINYQYRIIHGHFKADKYKQITSHAKYTVFFRDPISRVVSHYFYLKKQKDKILPLRDMIRDNQLSLKEFCQLEFIKNYYQRFVTKFIEIEDLSFVGLTEYYEESIRLFNRIFHTNLEVLFLNQGVVKDYDSIINHMGIYSEIKESQKENQLIYDQARIKFDRLRQEYL